jgi:hypothetical protein
VETIIKDAIQTMQESFKRKDWNSVHNLADRIKNAALKLIEDEMYKGVDSPYEQ